MPDLPDYPLDPAQDVVVPAEPLKNLMVALYVKQGMFRAEAEIAASRQIEAETIIPDNDSYPPPFRMGAAQRSTAMAWLDNRLWTVDEDISMRNQDDDVDDEDDDVDDDEDDDLDDDDFDDDDFDDDDDDDDDEEGPDDEDD